MLRRFRILSVSCYILAAGGEQRAGKFTVCIHTETFLHRISPAPAQLKYIPLKTAQAQCKKNGCTYTFAEKRQRNVSGLGARFN